MFRVAWLQSALDDLTTLWIQADPSLRQALTAASPEAGALWSGNAPGFKNRGYCRSDFPRSTTPWVRVPGVQPAFGRRSPQTWSRGQAAGGLPCGLRPQAPLQ